MANADLEERIRALERRKGNIHERCMLLRNAIAGNLTDGIARWEAFHDRKIPPDLLEEIEHECRVVNETVDALFATVQDPAD